VIAARGGDVETIISKLKALTKSVDDDDPLIVSVGNYFVQLITAAGLRGTLSRGREEEFLDTNDRIDETSIAKLLALHFNEPDGDVPNCAPIS
jgi:hypothetical protein